jgi:hypothetical protein
VAGATSTRLAYQACATCESVRTGGRSVQRQGDGWMTDGKELLVPASEFGLAIDKSAPKTNRPLRTSMRRGGERGAA